MIKKIENNSGIVFKLADVMREKGYSKQGYYLGNISRVDLYVLASMCKELKCNVQDIIEFKE